MQLNEVIYGKSETISKLYLHATNLYNW